MRLSQDLRGKVVVLNFWATWCPPCVEETPSLNLLQQWIAPNGGVVLGVSLDEDQSAYENFLPSNNVGFPTYRDPSKQIAISYGTTMYPETYVIDRQGRIDLQDQSVRKDCGPAPKCSPISTPYSRRKIHTPELESLTFGSLTLQQKRFRKTTFSANLEGTKILIPGTVGRIRFSFTPQLELV